MPAETPTDAERWDRAEDAAELLREGDRDGAIRALEAVLAADPANAYALCWLGHARFEAGDDARALKSYVAALTECPEYLGAMVGAAQALRRLGRFDEAVRMAQLVLERSPEDQDALYLLGCVHFHRGEDALARRFLARFLATRPEAELVLEVQGMLQVLAGQVLPLREPSDDELS